MYFGGLGVIPRLGYQHVVSFLPSFSPALPLLSFVVFVSHAHPRVMASEMDFAFGCPGDHLDALMAFAEACSERVASRVGSVP